MFWRSMSSSEYGTKPQPQPQSLWSMQTDADEHQPVKEACGSFANVRAWALNINHTRACAQCDTYQHKRVQHNTLAGKCHRLRSAIIANRCVCVCVCLFLFVCVRCGNDVEISAINALFYFRLCRKLGRLQTHTSTDHFWLFRIVDHYRYKKNNADTLVHTYTCMLFCTPRTLYKSENMPACASISLSRSIYLGCGCGCQRPVTQRLHAVVMSWVVYPSRQKCAAALISEPCKSLQNVAARNTMSK